MKKLQFALVAIATMFFVVNSKAQTADDIIAKHIAAIGGKDKLSSINSMYMEMNSEVMGNTNEAQVTVLNGKGYKMETSYGGQDIVQVITDKGGWSISPMNGSTDAQPMPDEQYNMSKDQINIGSPFLNYPANGYKAQLMGRDSSEGGAYKLQLTSPGGAVITDYIDPNTYYIVKAVVVANNQQTTIAFSDFKKTDFGYVMPYTISTTVPQGFTISSTISKVTFNQPVDPKIYDMPK